MYNKCIFIGNLTRDPEQRYTPQGTSVSSFSVAVNRKFKVGDEIKEDVLFISCVVFGKRADVCGQYLHKGSQILVEGVLTEDKWETDDGQKKSRMKLIVSDFKFLSKKQDRPEGEGSTPEEQSELEPF